jgi:hypothetical protein
LTLPFNAPHHAGQGGACSQFATPVSRPIRRERGDAATLT